MENFKSCRKYSAEWETLNFSWLLNEMIKPDLVESKIRFVQTAVLSLLWMYFTCCWITYEYHQLTISSCVSVRMSRYWARGKFGEHERGVRVARGAAECNSSLLSALQTSQVLNISTYALLKHELIKEWFAHAIARTARGNDNNNNTHLFSLLSVNKFKRFLLNFLIKHMVNASLSIAELWMHSGDSGLLSSQQLEELRIVYWRHQRAQ